MAISTTEYALGTSITREYPWGLNVSARALCADGKVRKVARIAQTADTYFSVPAAVRIRGKYVAGYVTCETRDGYSTATESDPVVLKFRAYTYRKNAALLA